MNFIFILYISYYIFYITIFNYNNIKYQNKLHYFNCNLKKKKRPLVLEVIQTIKNIFAEKNKSPSFAIWLNFFNIYFLRPHQCKYGIKKRT